jgi:hypothetical protein
MSFLKKFFDACCDDTFVKTLFDHIRNYALCGLVFFAADQMRKNGVHGQFTIGWLREALIVCVYVVGAILTFVNLVHGTDKLKKVFIPWWLRIVMVVTYIQIMTSLLWRTQP